MAGDNRNRSVAYWDEFMMRQSTRNPFRELGRGFGRKFGKLAMAGAVALTVAGCNQFAGIPKHMRPLSSSAKMLIEKKGMTDKSPILVRIFKQESQLEIWKQQKQTGKFALLKTYDICKWSGDVGPKFREGDRQAPEGFYTIRPAQMNPNSAYHLSFNLGYPNSYDRAHGRTGAHLMVHGACSSRGCYSMDDEQIQEIYTLARLSFQGGQRDFQVQAFPFRMTPANLAEHRKSPHYEFWQMLKEGHDHFEVTGLPPKVDVCDKRYVFNMESEDGAKFNPTAQCPVMSMPEPIRMAVQDRQIRDNSKTQQLIARLEAKENGRGPLNSLFGNTAVAEAESGPQSTPSSYVVASEPAPAAATNQVAAKPEQPVVDTEKSSVATAYMPEDKPEGDSFISGLMKRIW